MIKRRFNSSIDSFLEEDDLNPLEFMANLSDAMLVLAVGIMLALVLAWNVDIGHTAADVEKIQQADVIEEEALIFDGSQDSNEEMEDLGLSEYGRVFVDENGNMYVLKED